MKTTSHKLQRYLDCISEDLSTRKINYDELNAEIFNPFENASYDDLDEYYKHRERHSIYAIKLTAVMAVMCLIGLIVSELLNN